MLAARAIHTYRTLTGVLRSVQRRRAERVHPPAWHIRHLHLAARQDESRLTIVCTTGEHLELSTVWMSIGDVWIPLGTMTQDSVVEIPDARRFRCVIDLDRVSALAAGAVGDDAVDPGNPAQGFRARLYVDARMPCRARPRAYVREVHRDNTAVTFRDPIGRYRRTDVPAFATHRSASSCVTPYVNSQGIVSFYIDRPPSQYAYVVNEGLTATAAKLSIVGRIESRHVEVVRAVLILQGRTSGYQGSSPVGLTFDQDRTERRFGLRSYRFTADYDVGNDLGRSLTSDDVADLYLRIYPRHGEPYKKRISRSRYIVRILSHGGFTSSGALTLSVVPYYTFKSRSPSLHLEVFDTDEYRYLRQAIRRAPFTRRGERPVWVIGELPYKAQDNGLHLFRYLRDHHPEIDAYYVLRSGSPERRNLDGYDHVLDFRSKEHVDALLAADRIIGTHNPAFLFPTRDPRFARRIRAPKVFLQHGVTGAKWMVPNYGRRAHDFETDLICVCSEREKEFFVTDFGYKPAEVAVTGFARFDALFEPDTPKVAGQVFIMPTWRPWLQDPETFTESDYYHRWNALLSSPELFETLEAYDGRAVLCLHPNMQQFSRHFTSERIRVVVQGEVDVQQLMKQSSVMITDYSSVAFDFAFLDRAVIYYQFDADRFHAPHADPQLELPGPLTSSREGVLHALRDALQRGGQPTAEFRHRTDRFLAVRDRHNCERIVTAIRDLDPHHGMIERVANSEPYDVAKRVARKSRRYMDVMKRAYSAFLKLPIDPDLIVFESGQGRHYSDSPRYIYEELVRRKDARTKVWVYNHQLPTRDDHTIVVKRMSPEYFWYLARAKYWVNNHNFPNYIRRRPDGVFIQTWHGTPLKRMFNDQEGFFGRDVGYFDRTRQSVAQWSVLVSPSSYATSCIRSAYGFDGPVLEVGYPRNDVLVDVRAAETGHQVRRGLGLDEHQRVILYAPTFRDDQPTTRGRFRFDLPLDLERFAAEFDDEWVLLIRTHVLISNPVEIPQALKDRIIDVSGYPDIQDLFLASDLLITDYSSSFFDYALLGRPIVFYAFDLEKYRDLLRGFYLDYGENLPGPIVRTEDDLWPTIRTLVEAEPGSHTRVQAFAQEYAPHDDGHAARRVVDELF